MKISIRKLLLIGILTLTIGSAFLYFNESLAKSNTPVKIGLLSPFTAPGDIVAGQEMRWGAELAVKYINQEMGGVLGKRPVKLIVEDDAGTAEKGVKGFRKLVKEDGVVSVVGQYHSSVCVAVNGLARELEVPLFATGASSSKITESLNPYIFSIIPLNPARARFWIGFVKSMGWKRVAVLAEDTDYGTGLKELLEKYGKEVGLEIKSTLFPRASTDLRSELKSIKSWKPDLVLNIGVPPAAYLIVKQAHDINLFPDVAMLASFAWPTRQGYWNALGKKGKGILFTTYFKPGMELTQLGDWMVSRYKRLHNEAPSFYALNVFGEILVLAQAINKAQSDNPKNIARALVKYPYKDWSGVVDFKEISDVRWHNVSSPLLVLQQTKARQTLEKSKLIWPPNLGGEGKVK